MVPVCFFVIGIILSLRYMITLPKNTVLPGTTILDASMIDQYGEALKRLSSVAHPGLLMAGATRFRRIFARDLIISACLTDDTKLLHDTLHILSVTQGTSFDATMGCEPGKIVHELPGVELERQLRTDYSASDSTAYYLIGIIRYWLLTQDQLWLTSHRGSIQSAVMYALRHIDDTTGIWWEDPHHVGNDVTRYALKVTYWKDSSAWNRPDGRVVYPAAYSITQAMYFAALRGLSQIPWTNNVYPATSSAKLAQTADNMRRALLTRLWEQLPDGGGRFKIGIDKQGDIPGLSSDGLHLLWFLEVGDLPEQMLTQLEASSRALVSPLGYRTLDTNGAQSAWYHGAKTVWPFEQAIIHQAALKFGLTGVMNIAVQMGSALGAIAAVVPTRWDVFPEYITFQGSDDQFRRSNGAATADVRVQCTRAPSLPLAPVDTNDQTQIQMDPTKVQPAEFTLSYLSNDGNEWRTAGDNPQLWTVAAVSYFGKLPSPRPLAIVHKYVASSPATSNQNNNNNNNVEASEQQQREPPLTPVVSAAVPQYRPCEIPRGARSVDYPIYCPREPQPLEFTCRDDSGTIPWHRINDDYCDCSDGSDEPGTSACSHIQNSFGFWCGRTKSTHIHLSKVNDGICDCCDGADETTSIVAGQCPQRC